jgi:hypothetical protein
MTIAGVLFLAVLDSINPSAIVVTLWLLSNAGARALAQVVLYVATIFATYSLLGAAMVLGIGALAPSLGSLLRGVPGLVVESLVGLALLVYSLTAPEKPPASPSSPRPSARTYAALVLLGASVTAMELPTAVPYFAAVALIVEAALPIHVWVPLLGVYNVIFVLPPLALLAGHLLFQQRLAGPYASLGQRLERGARGAMLWVAGLVGGLLFVTGVIEILARLL